LKESSPYLIQLDMGIFEIRCIVVGEYDIKNTDVAFGVKYN